MNEVHLAVSKRSSCVKCKHLLKLGELRGVDWAGHFYCKKCLKQELKEDINHIKEMKKEIKRLSHLNKRGRLFHLKKLKALREL